MNFYNMIASVPGDCRLPLLVGAGVLLLIIVVLLFFRKYQKKNTVTACEPSEELAAYRKNLRIDMTDRDFEQFLKFLEHYYGEQVTRRKNQIIARSFSNTERADLKDYYLRTVVPAYHVSVPKKEAFRKYLISRKIHGLDQAPAYKDQDHAVQTQQMAAEMTSDPVSGLAEKQFTVMKNVKLKLGDHVQEYDIIVLGETGLYYMDFQSLDLAAAMSELTANKITDKSSDGEEIPASASASTSTSASAPASAPAAWNMLHISESNHWSLQLVSDDGHIIQEKSLTNPTRQIVTQRLMIENILEEYMISVHPLLILQDEKIGINQEAELSFSILHPQEAAAAIRNSSEKMSESDRIMALKLLQEHRLN